MKKAKSEFPFIKLLMIINRDIQFVNEKISSSKISKRIEKIEAIEVGEINHSSVTYIASNE